MVQNYTFFLITNDYKIKLIRKINSLKFFQSNHKKMLTKTKWVIDSAQSAIDFEVKHLIISNVKGEFKMFNACVYTAGNDFTTAEIDFRITPSSISTGDIYRDEHLRSAVFFDADNHKHITFNSKSIKKSENEKSYDLWGDLTIKGISKKIKLALEFEGVKKNVLGKEKVNFKVRGKINRKDWQLNWNNALEVGRMMVSEEVDICCALQFKKSTIQDLELPLNTIMEQKSASKFY